MRVPLVTGAPPPGPIRAGRPVAPARSWRWRTFPVFFAASLTGFLTALLAQVLERSGNLALLALVAALPLAAGLSHLVSVFFLAPRLRRPER